MWVTDGAMPEEPFHGALPLEKIDRADIGCNQVAFNEGIEHAQVARITAHGTAEVLVALLTCGGV